MLRWTATGRWMQTEPSAVHRQVARELWQTYCALLQQGFDQREAITIVAQLATQMWHVDED
jgi:hypothetical protein